MPWRLVEQKQWVSVALVLEHSKFIIFSVFLSMLFMLSGRNSMAMAILYRVCVVRKTVGGYFGWGLHITVSVISCLWWVWPCRQVERWSCVIGAWCHIKVYWIMTFKIYGEGRRERPVAWNCTVYIKETFCARKCVGIILWSFCLCYTCGALVLSTSHVISLFSIISRLCTKSLFWGGGGCVF